MTRVDAQRLKCSVRQKHVSSMAYLSLLTEQVHAFCLDVKYDSLLLAVNTN